eukprot:gb/GECH01013619.1/.p1 GENE.gb/GECH01013619.1/~~gb/GECH01013619.1/.p1  ORF type:complete len:216 (+),score=57.16 gb/GECH01013619.1/:1-648(+)
MIHDDFRDNNYQRLTRFTPEILRHHLSADQRYHILGRRSDLPTIRDGDGKGSTATEIVFPYVCPFCDPRGSTTGRIADSWPGHRFYALFNLRPVFPGHSMVIPRMHVERYEDVAAEHAEELHTFLQTTIAAVKKTYEVDSYNLLIQEGKASGQSMRHLHIHILPRKPNDVGDREWHDHFKEQEHTVRQWTEEERNLEAEKIRNNFPEKYKIEKID